MLRVTESALPPFRAGEPLRRAEGQVADEKHNARDSLRRENVEEPWPRNIKWPGGFRFMGDKRRIVVYQIFYNKCS